MKKIKFNFFAFSDSDYLNKLKKHLVANPDIKLNNITNNFEENIPLAMLKEGKVNLLIDLLQSDYLKKFDLNLNLKDRAGWTLAHYAADSNNENLLSVLLRNNIDISLKNNDDLTPIEVSIENLKEQSFRILLVNGNYTNYQKNQLLFRALAVKNNYRFEPKNIIVNLLITIINDLNEIKDNNALIVLCKSYSPYARYQQIGDSELSVVHQMISKRININLIDQNNKNALNYSIENNLKEITNWLIDKKINIDLSHLDTAIDKKDHQTINKLIDILINNNQDLSKYENDKRIKESNLLKELFLPVFIKNDKDKINASINNPNNKNSHKI